MLSTHHACYLVPVRGTFSSWMSEACALRGGVPEHRDSGLLPALQPSPSGFAHGIAPRQTSGARSGARSCRHSSPESRRARRSRWILWRPRRSFSTTAALRPGCLQFQPLLRTVIWCIARGTRWWMSHMSAKGVLLSVSPFRVRTELLELLRSTTGAAYHLVLLLGKS